VSVRVPDPPLGDGIVGLRPADERDLPAIEAGISDAEVVRWIGPPEATPEGVLALNRERWAAGSPTFAIHEGDDACVGLVWINRGSENPSVGYVGYWLLPKARGRGVATRAVRLISAWALRELGTASLALTTDTANARSQAVAERSGFRRASPRRTADGLDARNVLFRLEP
jgi:RimJ/RimL family protein N-acetyltransferase